MIKRFIIVAILLAIIIILGVGKDEKAIPSNGAASYENPEEVSPDYIYFFFNLKKSDKISLVDNTKEKKTFDEILQLGECKKLISGGFYKNNNNENLPIGLFKTAGETLNLYSPNNLFNGVLNIDEEGFTSIDDFENKDSVISLQTGPLIMRNREIRSAHLETDKNARRMIAGVDANGFLYFFTFYRQESTFMGPTLEELPKIIKKVSLENNLDIISAINLDGGSASFYYDGINKLNELVIVGSYFCIN